MLLGRVALAILTTSLVTCLVPACSRTANVTEAYTALDEKGDRRRNIFFTDTQEIHCVAEIASSRPDVTFQIQIRQVQRFDFEIGQTVDDNRIYTGPLELSGLQGTGTKFAIGITHDAQPTTAGVAGEKESPYGVGRYVCEVLLDGDLAATAIFNIAFPDCPDGDIIDQAKCAFFFPSKKVCPHFGATSTDKNFCTCDYVKGWQCDPL